MRDLRIAALEAGLRELADVVEGIFKQCRPPSGGMSPAGATWRRAEEALAACIKLLEAS